MIGKFIIGKSFGGCIRYCLQKDLAEVLDYNLCYGDKKELIKQFNEVRNLNPKLQKPVQHITLSLPKGEQLSEAQLAAIAAECARDLGFEKNQYIVIQHRDTGHQHIHIVANRVGFDGKTVKDNHNYRKMSEFCRKMELKYKLQKVLSPRRYLPPGQRNLPRLDQRKEQLKKDIQESLAKADNYQDFAEMMKAKGYKIEKTRGIAFIDAKKVRTKGSEVGYSLSRISNILNMPKHERNRQFSKEIPGLNSTVKSHLLLYQKHKNNPLLKDSGKKLVTGLLKPESNSQNQSGELLPKKRRKKKKLRL